MRKRVKSLHVTFPLNGVKTPESKSGVTQGPCQSSAELEYELGRFHERKTSRRKKKLGKRGGGGSRKKRD